ncbi:MAG: hypothetical protein QW353_08495 [Candidatus Korarchaeum sp.]
MSETLALLLVVVIFVILFTIGLWRSNKIFRRYVEVIREQSSPFSEYVGFIRYGRGFKALCIPKRHDVFTRIDVSVSLTWRENPMFYLISPLFGDKDRISLWGELVRMPNLDVQIVRNRKQLEGTCEALKDIYLDEFKITVFTDQVSEARRFIESIRHELKESLDCLEYLRIGRDFKWVKVVGNIKSEGSIRNMFDLLLKVGESLSNL